MFRFGFLFLFGFSCLFFCEGAVFPPSNGTNVTFIPGSRAWKIMWSFDDTIERFSYRLWVFTPSDGRRQVGLAEIRGDGDARLLTTSYEVAVEKPATLVLKNVNLTYNGTYQFSLSPGAGTSEVVVYIAVKPNATACSSPIIVNEGDNVSCACQGQGGNPPADVTWYKDNRKIGGTGKEEKTLTLTNVINEKNHGSYKCVAQSYPNEMFQDEDIVKVIVNYKPNKTQIEVPEEAYVGEKLVINCYSEGLPTPSFTITHNVTTNIVSHQSRYTKDKVDYSDAGLYECISKNFLGSDADFDNLIVKEKRPSTKSATTQSTTTTTTQSTIQSTPSKTADKASSNDTSCNCRTEWYIIVVTLVAGIIIGILFSYIVSCSRRKFGSQKPQSCPEPRACDVDSTYQELDLTKMKTEDNYQSLRVNAGINNVANGNDSNYSELSKVRDVENNYQSLT